VAWSLVLGFVAIHPAARAQGAKETFSHYATPTECAMAARWHQFVGLRTLRPDTMYVPGTGVTELPSTVAAVRACLARFTVANTPARDLLGLGQGYLAAEQPDQAALAFAAVSKNVASAPAPTRGWTLYQIVSIASAAPRPNVPLAEKYLAELETLGSAAAEHRLLAHTELARAARVMDSIPLWQREVDAALKASNDLKGDQRKVYAYASADMYDSRAWLKARLNDGAGALAELDAGLNALSGLRPRVAGVLEGEKSWFTPLGHAAPPIQAALWANTGPAGNKRPVTGKPSMIVFANAAVGGGAYSGYAILRRLVAKYGAQGFDVTLVTRTGGYFRSKLVAPDTELVKNREYFIDYLKLPFALAVWKTPLSKRDDGQVMVSAAPNEQAYQPPRPDDGPFSGFIIDAKGNVRLIAGVGKSNEAMIDHVIQSLF